jgi:hypothetical protein
MSYPQNPETIVIKNKFYPRGLREIDIWNYYQRVKRQMLDTTRNRDVMLGIMVDTNKPIIRRRGKQEQFIRLSPNNYDEVITGRSVTIYSTMGSYEDFGIIDIDIDPRDGFAWARKTTLDVYDFVTDKIPIVASASIRFTGKSSFHIVCEFSKKMKIDSIRFLLERFLRQSDLSKVYTIGAKRHPGVPNLDLFPNKYRGAYITLNSLSIWGLRCIEVPYRSVASFNPMSSRIRK